MDRRRQAARSVPGRCTSRRVASRLTPAARPSPRERGRGARQDQWPERGTRQQEEEDGHHRRPDGGSHERDGIHGASVLPRTGRVTSDLAIGRRVAGSLRSVRQRLAAIPRRAMDSSSCCSAAVAIHGGEDAGPVLRPWRPPVPLGPDATRSCWASFPPGRAVRRAARPTTRPGSTCSWRGSRGSPGWTCRRPRPLLGIAVAARHPRWGVPPDPAPHAAAATSRWWQPP